MPNSLILIFVIISLAIVVSPVYLQRRKLWRMADEDLKRIDNKEWQKQMRSNAYIKLGSRIIWGLFILSGFILRFQQIIALGFSWLAVFVFLFGISLIVWGILGFRQDLKRLNKNLYESFKINFRAAEPRGIKRKDSVDLNLRLRLDF